jgi:adenine-specific DNA glycosylase
MSGSVDSRDELRPWTARQIAQIAASAAAAAVSAAQGARCEYCPVLRHRRAQQAECERSVYAQPAPAPMPPATGRIPRDTLLSIAERMERTGMPIEDAAAVWEVPLSQLHRELRALWLEVVRAEPGRRMSGRG